MKAKIRKGAWVGQDHGYYEWPHHKPFINQIFEISDFVEGRKELVAEGFGLLNLPGQYGNGALFVKEEDLILVEEGKMNETQRDEMIDMANEITELLEALKPFAEEGEAVDWKPIPTKNNFYPISSSDCVDIPMRDLRRAMRVYKKYGGSEK